MNEAYTQKTALTIAPVRISIAHGGRLPPLRMGGCLRLGTGLFCIRDKYGGRLPPLRMGGCACLGMGLFCIRNKYGGRLPPLRMGGCLRLGMGLFCIRDKNGGLEGRRYGENDIAYISVAAAICRHRHCVYAPAHRPARSPRAYAAGLLFLKTPSEYRSSTNRRA